MMVTDEQLTTDEEIRQIIEAIKEHLAWEHEQFLKELGGEWDGRTDSRRGQGV